MAEEKKKRGRPKKADVEKADSIEKAEAEQVNVEEKRGGVGVNGNLIPFNQMTEEEHREISRRAGIASGESKRRRKAIREFLNDFLDADAAPLLKSNMQKLGVPAEDQSNYAALCMSLFSKAVNHADINAFRTLMEYAGRAPLQEMRENEAIAKMSQVMQLAGQNSNGEDGDDYEDVVFYIPDNGRTIIKEEDLVTVD